MAATGLAGRLRKTVDKATAVSQALADITNPGGTGGITGPSLVTDPGIRVTPGGATSVAAAGAVAVPDQEPPGFLATWWPALAALAAGLIAFFAFDVALGWSVGIAVGALLLIYAARMFLGG